LVVDSIVGSLFLLLAVGAVIWRFGWVLRQLWQTAEIRGLLLTTAVTLLAGMFIFRALEGWSYLDALYFSLITLTTVGYGDFSPVTPLGKIMTMIYILLGLGIISSFVLAVAQALPAVSRGKETAG
jgi:voltage-gated potassium channel Kch